jgi:hypothetical protein
MLKFICFIGLIVISFHGISQKGRYFKFIDAQTGEVLTDMTLTAMRRSKATTKQQYDILCLTKHKKKNLYYLTADDYESRELSPLEIPKKGDTAFLLVLPSTSLMDERWKKLYADTSNSKREDLLISFKNTRVFEAWVADKMIITRAAMIHCENSSVPNPTFSFLVEFGADDIGIYHFRSVEYAEDSPECIHIFRELELAVRRMKNVQIEDAIEGRKEVKQRLMLPITIGL